MSRRTSVTRAALLSDEPAATPATATRLGGTPPAHQAVSFSPTSTIRPTFDSNKGLYSSKRSGGLPAFVRSPRIALNLLATINVLVLGYLLLRSEPTPAPPLPSRLTEDLLNLTLATPILQPSRQEFESCEVCVLQSYPDEMLCQYGVDNIRLSRQYEGSGFRVRRFLEKALRGEAISIAVLTGTEGRGVEASMLWHSRFMETFLIIFPNTKLHVGTSPGGNSEVYCRSSSGPVADLCASTQVNF